MENYIFVLFLHNNNILLLDEGVDFDWTILRHESALMYIIPLTWLHRDRRSTYDPDSFLIYLFIFLHGRSIYNFFPNK